MLHSFWLSVFDHPTKTTSPEEENDSDFYKFFHWGRGGIRSTIMSQASRHVKLRLIIHNATQEWQSDGRKEGRKVESKVFRGGLITLLNSYVQKSKLEIRIHHTAWKWHGPQWPCDWTASLKKWQGCHKIRNAFTRKCRNIATFTLFLGKSNWTQTHQKRKRANTMW